jgi:hypothetical protein
MHPSRRKLATLLLGMSALCAFAQQDGFSWVKGYLQATVTYNEGGKRKKLRVLSEFTSFCMWESMQPATLKREFEDTVSTEYSKYSGVQVTSVLFRPASLLEYQHTRLARDGHDEVMSNGFSNTSYTSKCK